MSITKESAECNWLAGATVEDIRNAKKQIWTLTYYALLTYAAIITFYLIIYNNANAIFDTFPKKFWFEILFFWLPSYVINLTANYHLHDTSKCLSMYRIRLVRLKNRMEPFIRNVFDVDVELPDKYVKFTRYFLSLTFVFIIILNIGSMYIFWIILCRHKVEPLIFCTISVYSSSLIINYFWACYFNEKVVKMIEENRRDLK